MFSWLRKQPVGEDTTKLQLPPIQTSSTSTAEPDTAPRSFPTSPSEESSPYPNSLSGFLMEMLGVSSQNVDQLPETPEATSARDLSKAFDEYEELEVEDDYAKRKRERLERSAEPPASVTDVPTLFEATNEKLRSASSLSSSLSHRNSATQSVSNSREALTPLSPFETARKPVVLVGRNDNTDIVLTQDTAEKVSRSKCLGHAGRRLIRFAAFTATTRPPTLTPRGIHLDTRLQHGPAWHQSQHLIYP